MSAAASRGGIEVFLPGDRLAEAVSRLADAILKESLTLPVAGTSSVATLEAGLRVVEETAQTLPLEARRLAVALENLPQLFRARSTFLLLIAHPDGLEFVACTRGGARRCRVLGSDLRAVEVSRRALVARIEERFLQRHGVPIVELLSSLDEQARADPRVRSRLAAEWFGPRPLFTAVFLVPAPDRALLDDPSMKSALRYLGMVVAGHTAQYLFFVGSWWCLGRATLLGQLDAGWLWAWGLLLLSAAVSRLVSVRSQYQMAMRFGAALKKRLLYGATRLATADVRWRGVGESLGQVFESEAAEQMVLGGGLATLLAGIELAFAVGILLVGAAPVAHVATLLGWLAFTLALGYRFLLARRRWTRRRNAMTQELVEQMLGHRTRLAQGLPEELSHRLDGPLVDYLRDSRRMDRLGSILMALIPRGWMVLGACVLIPAFVAGSASSTKLAVSVGGILLAFRGLQRLEAGLWDAAGAIVAAGVLRPLLVSARQPEERPRVGPAKALPTNGPNHGPLLFGRNLSFQYPRSGSAALRSCDLEIRAGDRVLLKGASGSGKSTLVALLSGLERPTTGLLLLDGLDRESVGARPWRRRVAAAPQFHENHVFSGPLAFNLLFGRDWPPTDEDLDQADRLCRDLGLGPLLAKMPSGLFEYVGETGWQLSHGERSLLFLARALLQKPRVLILDESLSSLDPCLALRALDVLHRQDAALVVISHL